MPFGVETSAVPPAGRRPTVGAVAVDHEVVADPRWRTIGVVVAVLVAVVGTVAAAIAHLWAPQWEMIDLAVYRWGGTRVVTDELVYEGAWTGVLPFTYTPFAALVFVPVSLVPTVVAQYLMIAATGASLYAVVAMTLRALGYTRSAATTGMVVAIATASLALEPVVENLKLGQINIILMAVVLWDLLLPDDSRWKGIGVGVAAGLKLTPALFVVYLLVTGRPVPAVRAIATFAGTVIVGWLLLPTESDAFWIGRLFMDPTRVGGPEYVGNQSINAGLVRLIDQREQAVWVVVALVVAVGGLAVARRAHRRGAELAGILVCAFTGLLVSPISWSHHWVWVVPVFAWVVHVAATRRGWAWAAPVVMLAVLSAPGWLWLLPRGGAVERSWSPWQMLVGSSYVLVTLAGMAAFAAWSARRAPRGAPAAPPP